MGIAIGVGVGAVFGVGSVPAPTATIDSPSTSTTFVKETNVAITVSGTCTDSTSVEVFASVGGGAYASWGTDATVGGGTFSVTRTIQAGDVGTIAIKAVATGPGGTTDSGTVSVVVASLLALGAFVLDPNDTSGWTLVGTAVDTALSAIDATDSIAAPSSGVRPNLNTTDLLNGYPCVELTDAASSRMTAASGGVTGNAAHTMVCVLDLGTATSVGVTMMHGNDLNSKTQSIIGAGHGIGARKTWYGANGVPAYSIDGGASIPPMVAAKVYASGRHMAWVDGQQVCDFAEAVNIASAAINLGSPLANYTDNVKVYWAAWIPSDVGDAVVHSLTSWACNRFGVTRRGTTVRTDDAMVVAGDSVAASYMASAPDKMWSSIVCSGRSLSRQVAASPGATIATTLTDTYASKQYNASRTCVLVLYCGINDLGAGTSGLAVYNNLATYGAARQAEGFKVVACTIMPSLGLSAGEELERQDCNTRILAGYSGWADACVDLAADSRLDDASDATYFADNTHMTDAGEGVLAELIGPAVYALL